MSGRRYRKEPELEVTEPATDGAGEGMREGAQLPDNMEKWSGIETHKGKRDYNPNIQEAQFSVTILQEKGTEIAKIHQILY